MLDDALGEMPLVNGHACLGLDLARYLMFDKWVLVLAVGEHKAVHTVL